MRLSLIKRMTLKLTPSQLQRLDAWIHAQLHAIPEKSKTRDGRTSTTERRIDNKTYRLEGIRCGKEKCKCADGELHGPYWYAYWSENCNTKSRYIGKTLPKNLRGNNNS